MAITPRLDLRQSQSLVMTPQLQQAIKLLQLSNVELSAYVEDELLRNPMLERDENVAGPDDAGRGEAKAARPTASADAVTRDARRADGDRYDAVAKAMRRSTSITRRCGAKTVPATRRGRTGPTVSTRPGWTASAATPAGAATSSSGRGNLEATVSDEPTLRDHLMEQLVVDIADPADRMIGIQLIESLDAAGWLSEPVEQIGDRLNCPAERVERVLEILQRFEPAGLFARNLKECLALQLARSRPARSGDAGDAGSPRAASRSTTRPRCSSSAASTRRTLPTWCRSCARSIRSPRRRSTRGRADRHARHHHAPASRRRLDRSSSIPRRCRGFSSTSTISPASAPRCATRRNATTSTSCFQSANWLVKSLHQRATTILKVVGRDRAAAGRLFPQGRRAPEAARPARHRRGDRDARKHRQPRHHQQVHSDAARHVRAQVFLFRGDRRPRRRRRPLGRGGALPDQGADRRGAVRQTMLSDDRIVEILNAEGIDIARRTVAKYREAMKIPSSVQRRRLKNQSF